MTVTPPGGDATGDAAAGPPGRARDRVAAFDARVDRALEPLRDHGLGRVFHLATTAADHSMLWVAIALVHGLAVRRDGGATLLFVGLIALESLVVNQVIKPVFRRTRPTVMGDVRFRVRRPRSSSFPSGHASSAVFAATLLTAWTSWAWAPLWVVLALVVAASRAVVRIHHPSDVVAGLVVGALLAQLALAAGAGGVLG